jgi:MraZ protein
MSNAADVKLDKAGRIIVPKDLLDIAGIKKEVVMRGVLDKFELWDPEILKKYETGLDQSYEDIAKQLLL